MPTPLTPPPPHLDPASRPPTVSAAAARRLSAEGIGPLQARFAAEVMFLGGVFLPTQVDTWLLHHQPDYSSDLTPQQQLSYRTHFLQDLFRAQGRRLPVAKRYRLPDPEVEYGRMASRYYYTLLGQPNSRYARESTTQMVVNRLLLYDYVVTRPDLAWYGSEDRKKKLFLALDIDSDAWPSTRFGSRRSGAPSTVRYFADHQPIGLGEWAVYFPFAGVFDRQGGLAQVVAGYAGLFDALRRRGFAPVLVFCAKAGAYVPMRRLPEALPFRSHDHTAFVDALVRYLYRLAYASEDDVLLDAHGGRRTVAARCDELRRRTEAWESADGRPVEVLVHTCPALPIERSDS